MTEPVTDPTEVQRLLDALPAPLEPMDVCALDGFLVGVLLQPQRVPSARWLAHVADVDARPAPAGAALQALHDAVGRRHAELGVAIAARQWFDPWVYDLGHETQPLEAVMPWVAGFATALTLFPGLEAIDDPALVEPLAVLYAALDPEDLEDADELLAEIETLEPPATLDDAVEDLVRCTLLLADVSRPLAETPKPAAKRRASPQGAVGARAAGRAGPAAPGPAGVRPSPGGGRRGGPRRPRRSRSSGPAGGR